MGGAKVCLLCFALLMVLTGHAYACAMTAVVGNGTTMLTDQMAWHDEASWLQGTSHTNNDGWGACYYHASGYAQHHYQLLPVDDNSFPSRSDHYYRTDTNIGAPQSPTVGGYSNWAQSEQGKILLAHARNASSGEPSGAFAPFIYHSEAENIDYSFAHHGEVPKHSMINDIPGFADFLISYDYENNTNYFSSPNSNVDSAYLFLWIMQNIGENDGDVKLGIAAALNEIAYDRRYQINILLSDGDGVYAYTNNRDSGHRMGYVNDTSDNELSYLVRSWKAPVLSWAEGSFTSIDTHHLYYFPTQGQMEITHNVDKSIPASFALKPGLNWIGFPVLESTYGSDPDYTLSDVNPYAMTLQTKNGTELQEPWEYNIWSHTWDENAIITRTNGYILNMGSTLEDYEYTTFGLSTSYNTPLTLYQNNENWVPYFIEYSQTPTAAFGNDISHVTAIYAQDWYIYKFKGQWYGYVQPGATGTLDYGKMYKVYVDQTISDFTWSAWGMSQSFVKGATEYFEFEEQPEYQAIVIESIADNPVFDEIGVFKDSECVGALKFEGYPLNLQVYDDSSPDDYSYVLYSKSKDNNLTERKYTSSAIDINNKVIDNGKHLFSVVSLTDGKEGDTSVHPALSAMIYPNPMYGNANIEIKATGKSAVDISIYNLKGQLVRKINSTEVSKGSTSFVWDGKTDNGRQVAQGIYFCKIKSPNTLLTKKLIVIR